MPPPTATPDDSTPSQPGKIRTWWHPLLVRLLRWQLGEHYRVDEEVPVGKKPLQIDIILVHKEHGELPAHARVMLAGIVERLGEFTLVEFKSPSDTLRAGDLHTFLAYALLYRAQNDPLLAADKLHLLVIAPQLTKAYADELRALGVAPHAEGAGVWRLQGGAVVHPMWLLETNVLAGAQHPLLTVVSPAFRRDAAAMYESLSKVGYDDMIVYMAQQIGQFQFAGKEFAMQHLGASKEMHEALREIIKKLPLETRRHFLSVEEIPVEERLKGLTFEERVKGLSAEEILGILTPAERERLRHTLQQPTPETRQP